MVPEVQQIFGIKREYRLESGAVPATVVTIQRASNLSHCPVPTYRDRTGRQGDRVISQETCHYIKAESFREKGQRQQMFN